MSKRGYYVGGHSLIRGGQWMSPASKVERIEPSELKVSLNLIKFEDSNLSRASSKISKSIQRQMLAVLNTDEMEKREYYWWDDEYEKGTVISKIPYEPSKR
jgi:hypothetical protein